MTYGTSNGGGGGGNSPLSDLSAFPVLTESVGARGRSGQQPVTGGEMGELVAGTLRQLLGWKPDGRDPAGFGAALSSAFELREVDGHIESRYLERNYAVQIRSDMGAVTGAQASIYARAQSALDHALPLLDGLKPLRTDADPQDCDAVRSLVRGELQSLVAELGQAGGPRVQRVESLFVQLLGPESNDGSARQPGGHLKTLQTRFGLDPRRVNTLDEEVALTNFIIVADHAYGMQRSWADQRHYFDRAGQDSFLGTELLLLSRTLAVVAESVEEVRSSMDSVFLGDAQRQTLTLMLPARQIRLPVIPLRQEGGHTVTEQKRVTRNPARSDPSMYVSELLDWVETVAVREGPRIIQDAGKDGVTSFMFTLDRLRRYVRAALITENGGLQSADRLPGGYRTPRVQRAIQELATQLDDATDHSARVGRGQPPKVRQVLVNGGFRQDSQPHLVLLVLGEHFQQGATVRLTSGTDGDLDLRRGPDHVHWQDSGMLSVTVDPGDLLKAARGDKDERSWSLSVTNPDELSSEPVYALAWNTTNMSGARGPSAGGPGPGGAGSTLDDLSDIEDDPAAADHHPDDTPEEDN